MFTEWGNPDHWRQRRKDAMMCARKLKKILTNPTGHYQYAPDDERLKHALRFWVNRAKRYHALSLGRESLHMEFQVFDAGVLMNRKWPTNPATGAL